MALRQRFLFRDADEPARVSDEASSTFLKNMKLPVHRWFRYSAGFSADWVRSVIRNQKQHGPVRVFDPFAGSGTTLIAAETEGVESWGIDPHPFIARVAKAKLQWRSDPNAFLRKSKELRALAKGLEPDHDGYPSLIYKCYDESSLADLDALRRAYDLVKDDSPASQLVWLSLAAILRKTSSVGTAQWQYVLPNKKKSFPQDVYASYDEQTRMIYQDMQTGQAIVGPRARFDAIDARTTDLLPRRFANLVVTSPPYPNNYDYADATRLEMSFFREITGWGDLQSSIRSHLIRSCSQHVPERSNNLEEILGSADVDPIRVQLRDVCGQLDGIRMSKGGKKTYHLMVACYFRDLSRAWRVLRDVCCDKATVCFVIGDSAPYGVYVPVIPWLGSLAQAAGFKSWSFERTRDRNVKWKNRKHRVPLQEGRLWVEG